MFDETDVLGLLIIHGYTSLNFNKRQHLSVTAWKLELTRALYLSRLVYL